MVTTGQLQITAGRSFGAGQAGRRTATVNEEKARRPSSKHSPTNTKHASSKWPKRSDDESWTFLHFEASDFCSDGMATHSRSNAVWRHVLCGTALPFWTERKRQESMFPQFVRSLVQPSFLLCQLGANSPTNKSAWLHL